MRDLNPFWRQLPVYSPVTFRSILAGIAGALGHGEPIRKVRDLLTQEYGCHDLLLLDSGTSALRLAIEGALSEADSEIVALPAYCCFDVATAAIGADCRVALYDVCPETLGPDFESLRTALDAGAGAVVVAHLYGIPVDLDRCRALTAEYDAVLIEDAAQGAGGAWRDKPLGSLGDVGILSFGRGKGRTGGGGGALLVNRDRGVAILNNMRAKAESKSQELGTIARLAAQWAFGRPSLYGIPAKLPFLGLGETRYKEPWDPRLMPMGSAAALLINWEPSKREEAVRRAVAVRYNHPRQIPIMDLKRATPGWLRLPVRSTQSIPEIRSRHGVAEAYPYSLTELTALHTRMIPVDGINGATILSAQLLTYPCHSRVGVLEQLESDVPGEVIDRE